MLEKIPKFVFWCIAAFILITFVLFLKEYIIYKFFGPYSKYFTVECKFTDKTLFVKISAIKDLKNVSVKAENKRCFLGEISKESEKFCEFRVNRTFVPVQIDYIVDNKTKSAVIICEKTSILKKLFG